MRFVATGNFLFAVAVFFLPWIDVRCEMGGQQSKSIVEQSGYQIAAGEYSEGELIKDAQKEAQERGGNVGPMKMNKGKEGENEKGPDAAPLLWGFVALLGVGALLSLVVPGTMWRAGALVGVIGAAAILGIQTSQGFPVEQKVKEDMDKQDNAKKNQPAGAPKIDLGPLANPKIVVTYKPGFYLAWLLTVLPLLWIAVDAMIAKPPAKRGRSRYDEVLDERDRERGRGRDDDYDNDRENPFRNDD